MTRSLKVLGPAIVTALVLVASTSNALATNPQFHSEVEHVTLTGEQEVRHAFNVTAGTIHCDTATFHGTQTSQTTSEFTIAPTYQGCRITTITLETLELVVDMNGCHFLFTANGGVHLTCPSLPIRLTAPFCTITVHPQTISKVDYLNGNGGNSTRSVTVESTATNIAYTQSTFCPHGAGAFNNGTYTGSAVTTCIDTFANHAGCWWSTQ